MVEEMTADNRRAAAVFSDEDRTETNIRFQVAEHDALGDLWSLPSWERVTIPRFQVATHDALSDQRSQPSWEIRWSAPPDVATWEPEAAGGIVPARRATPDEDGGRRTRLVELSRPRAARTLTLRVRDLSDQLWAIVKSKALRTSFPITEARLEREDESEDQTITAVLRVYTEASAVQALAFWDGLSSELGNWLRRMDGATQTAAFEQLSLRIHWRGKRRG